MQTAATAATTDANTDRVLYATPRDVSAAFKDGGWVSVEEFPAGSAAEAGERAAKRVKDDGDAVLVIAISNDSVGGAAIDTVWFDPDDDTRLEVIRRARIALDNAEAALLAVGWMDEVHAGADAYKSLPQRERNAFEIGRDYERGQQTT